MGRTISRNASSRMAASLLLPAKMMLSSLMHSQKLMYLFRDQPRRQVCNFSIQTSSLSGTWAFFHSPAAILLASARVG